MTLNSSIGKNVENLTFANNRLEALNFLETMPINFIIICVNSDSGDSLETIMDIKACRRSWSNAPVVAVVDNLDYQQKKILRNIGISAFINKDVSAQDNYRNFQSTLETLLALKIKNK